jgi:ABC-type amino acid transport substrate-binding protein
MVTAFATGTVLVVLPLIAERCKALLAEHGIEDPAAETTVDVMVPTAYSFPSAGTLLGLGFVLFAAWYVGSPLSLAQYPPFTLLGALTAFGSMAVAIPFMLNYFSLPADLFQLYLLGSVVTARFATALAAMHGVVACLLGVVAVVGLLSKRALLQASIACVAVSGVVLFGLGLGLTRAIPYVYTGEEAFTAMALLTDPVDVQQMTVGEALAGKDLARPRLDVIQHRGTLRAGYLPDVLPYAYRSSAGDVVGFDIEILHGMARDLGVALEIGRVDWDEAVVALEGGRIDVLVGGLIVTPNRSMEVTFTESYLDKALGFAVRDSRRDEFPDLESMQLARGLTIAVPGRAYGETDVRQMLPGAEVIMLDSPRSFFRGEVEEADLLVMAAQSASAWTLIYPDYSVIIPAGVRITGSTSFAVPHGQQEMVRWLDTWLELKRKGGLLERLERHWIYGQQDQHRLRRWSIMKDILHWGQSDVR